MLAAAAAALAAATAEAARLCCRRGCATVALSVLIMLFLTTAVEVGVLSFWARQSVARVVSLARQGADIYYTRGR